MFMKLQMLQILSLQMVKTPFDVIDETLYGKEKFSTVKEKIDWVCQNFDKTQKNLE